MGFCSSGQQGAGANGATPALGAGAASGAIPAKATASNSFNSPPGGGGATVPPAPSGPSTDLSSTGNNDPKSLLDQFIKLRTTISGMNGGGGGMASANFGNAPTNVGSAGMATPGANIPMMQDPGASKYAQGGGGLHQMATAGGGKTGSL
jgi:hypothetical protein